MKFLFYSNSPDAPTGYGVQCAQLATRLKCDGHDVAVACTYGNQIGVRRWQTPYGPVTLYPSGLEPNSLDVLRSHALHFFGGDPKGGWIIALTDMWVMAPCPLDDFNVMAWTPVDHFPCPEGVIRFFHRNPDAIPVAMSRFGEKMLIEAGLTPRYAPLAVDTSVYRPTPEITVINEAGEQSVTPAREMYHIPADAFAVLMVSMNKDPQDRKGFNEAFRAFGAFWKQHQEAVLVVHSERFGAMGSGINLIELARHAAIPPHALIFTEQYAMQVGGLNKHQMAGLYSACDVLLAPSKGEGFGVPMVEAQACGLPVIASDFSAQTELIGAGWGVTGQLYWDAPQVASYLSASIIDIFYKLEDAHKGAKADGLAGFAIDFASAYDADKVYVEHWRPILESIGPKVVTADKPIMERVDVIVPLVRDANAVRLGDSYEATAPNDEWSRSLIWFGEEGRTYAENVNACYNEATAWREEHNEPPADFVLVVGDDCEFTPGWFEEARKLSDRYDVIGTNDSEVGRIRNPDVAAGRHADHFFVRRSYIDDDGASLDGPGTVISEAYGHWYSDKELVELAKARGVFGFAPECRIIHHHPGFDGNEAAREADPVYMKALESSEADRKTWMKRVPLIQALR
jgi:glycosyltransferase involved in cell wall biosynthesis